MLSMTTDYFTSTGCPEPYLQRIADAGYTHVHWCHQWNTDFLYDDCEIDQIAAWLRDCHLALTDLHASMGKEKNWGSVRKYERLAGVELVRNRIRMTSELGSDVIIMHLPNLKEPTTRQATWDSLRKSLDALAPYARQHSVRIAIENGDFEEIDPVLAMYPPDYLGLCYDCGHGNMRPDGLNRLDRLKDRLISVHLHDNDGTADQHNLPFWDGGTVDWRRLASILAKSGYLKWVNMESTMKNSGMTDEPAWLAKGVEAGTRLSTMIETCR